MKTNNQIWYAGALDIPAGKSGEVEIEHVIRPAGTKLTSGNFRTAMYGQKSKTIVFPTETRWHRLNEESYGTWMTDDPIEQRQADELVVGAHGRVLVGGLGLGYAVVALSTKPRVREIVVVERSADIIALVWQATVARVRTLNPRVDLHVQHEDLHDAMNQLHAGVTSELAFDWALFDIWQLDNEGTFHDTVVPLLRAARDRIGKVVCWNEDVMRGQLRMGLHSRMQWLRIQDAFKAAKATGGPVPEGFETMDAFADTIDLDKLATRRGSIYTDWAVPFWRWYRAARPDADVASIAAETYVRSYARVPDEQVCRMLEGFTRIGERNLGKR